MSSTHKVDDLKKYLRLSKVVSNRGALGARRVHLKYEVFQLFHYAKTILTDYPLQLKRGVINFPHIL